MNDILYRDLSGELSQLILGGTVNNGASNGMFCFNMNNTPSNSNWNVEASLTYIKNAWKSFLRHVNNKVFIRKCRKIISERSKYDVEKIV